jgi:hypothetical protein
MKDRVDWFLIIYGGFFDKTGEIRPKLNLRLKLLHTSSIDNDILNWYKKI